MVHRDTPNASNIHTAEMSKEKLLEALAEKDRCLSELQIKSAAIERQLDELQHDYNLAQRGARSVLWNWSEASGELWTSPDAWQKLRIADVPHRGSLENFTKVLHPDDYDGYWAALYEFLQSDAEEYVIEHRVRREDGEYIWVESHGIGVRDDNGKVIRMAGSLTDITARKEAEIALRNSEERYRLAMQGANEGLWDWDLESNNLYVSPRAWSLIGVKEESAGDLEAWRARIHPNDIESYWATIYAHLRGETELYQNEYRMQHTDGSYRWLRDRGLAQRYEDGQAHRMAGSIGDITENKKNLQALRESEERHALALTAANEGLWDIDMTAGMSALMDHAFKTSPYTSSDRVREIIGLAGSANLTLSDWRDRIHPDDIKRYFGEIRAYLKNETAQYDCEYRVRHEDGEYRWVRDRGHALRYENGDVYRMAGSIGDITDARRSQLELRRAKEGAESASRTKSQFLANMSHELRTPLNAIIGFSDTIAKGLLGPVGNPKYVEYVSDIKQSGEYLLALINDILDLSKIEAGEHDLHESKVDVESVIETCMRVIHERARLAGLTVDIPDFSELPALWVDERAVKQVVLNLLTNAVKFTPKGGTISVAANINATGGMDIRIIDTGIGMSETDIPVALTPFRQVDGSLSRQQDGTGLGLPLVKSLVELHQGTLAIESKVDEGTAITVTFPSSRIFNASQRHIIKTKSQ